MEMKKTIRVTFIVLRLALGSLMVWGGMGKFTGSKPPADQMLTLSQEKKAALLGDPDALKIRNYIFGMKQSGFAWELLGVAEMAGGLLLISQIFSFLGALMLLPVTIHIFLFHLVLEPHEPGEVILAVLYLIVNLALIVKEYRLFKPLIKLNV